LAKVGYSYWLNFLAKGRLGILDWRNLLGLEGIGSTKIRLGKEGWEF